MNKGLKVNTTIKSTNIVLENNTAFNYDTSFIDEEDNELILESDYHKFNSTENEILVNDDMLIKTFPKNDYQTSNKRRNIQIRLRISNTCLK